LKTIQTSTFLSVAALLLLIAIGLRAQTIEIVSSTPMGFPCAQNVESSFPCREADNGWLVLAKVPSKLVKAVLKYKDGEDMKTVTVYDSINETNGLANIAFRPGRWVHPSEVIEVVVTALHEGASIKRDAGGTTITPGPTVFGPPVARWNPMANVPLPPDIFESLSGHATLGVSKIKKENRP
jgi:hypothetical protein